MEVYPEEVSQKVPEMLRSLSYIFLIVMSIGAACICRNPQTEEDERIESNLIMFHRATSEFWSDGEEDEKEESALSVMEGIKT